MSIPSSISHDALPFTIDLVASATDDLRAYVDYLRDLGVHDLYPTGDPLPSEDLAILLAEFAPAPAPSAAPPQPRLRFHPENPTAPLPSYAPLNPHAPLRP